MLSAQLRALHKACDCNKGSHIYVLGNKTPANNTQTSCDTHAANHLQMAKTVLDTVGVFS